MSVSSCSTRSSFWFIPFFLGILGVAAWLRWPWVKAPFYIFYDEQHTLWAGVETLLGINLHFIPWFGTPYFLTLAIGVFFQFLVKNPAVFSGDLSGGPFQNFWAALEKHIAMFAENPAPQILLGREITLFLSLMTVAGVGLYLRRASGPIPAVVAAFFIAVLPMHLNHAGYLRPDMLQIALVFAVLFAAADAMESGRLHSWGFAGACFGIAVATKIESAMLLAPIFGMSSRPTRKTAGCFLGFMALIFLVSQPYMTSNSLATLQWVWRQWGWVHAYPSAGNRLVSLIATLVDQVGWPLMLAGMGSVVVMLRQGSKLAQLSAWTFLTCLVFNSLAIRRPQPHYFFIGFAALVVCFAEFVKHAFIWIGEKKTSWKVQSVFWVLVVLFVFPASASLRQRSLLIRRIDLTAEASQHLKDLAPAGTRIAVDSAINNMFLVPGTSMPEWSRRGFPDPVGPVAARYRPSLEGARLSLYNTPLGEKKYIILPLPYFWDEEKYHEELARMLSLEKDFPQYVVVSKPIQKLGVPIYVIPEINFYIYATHQSDFST